MKVNELMIGDWVFCTYKQRNYQVDEIKTVADDELKIVVMDDDVPLVFRDRYIEPIPLTKDILEKNGFEGDREVMQYHFIEDGQKYHFSLRQMYDKDDNPKGYSFFAFNVLTIIDYVHQLQHALKLCGIDKQIVL